MSFTLDGVVSDLYILHVGENMPLYCTGLRKEK
jgi:hypothetical protein